VHVKAGRKHAANIPNRKRLKKEKVEIKTWLLCKSGILFKIALGNIYPIELGGLSSEENLIFICIDCNQRKSNLTLHEVTIKFCLDRDSIKLRLLAQVNKF